MKAVVTETKKYYNNLIVEPDTTKTIYLPTGQYQIEMYGGGGCAVYSLTPDAPYGAGSGAGFKGIVNLNAGTYTITVGSKSVGTVSDYQSGVNITKSATATTLSKDSVTLISAGAGENGQWRSRQGRGGTLTVSANLDVVSTVLSSNGNNGRGGNVWSPSGGLSLYDNSDSGYGAGGCADGYENTNTYSGTQYGGKAGYFYIERLDGDIGYHPAYKCKVIKETNSNTDTYKALKSFEKGQYYGN